MVKIIGGVIIVALIGVGAFFLFGQPAKAPSIEQEAQDKSAVTTGTSVSDSDGDGDVETTGGNTPQGSGEVNQKTTTTQQVGEVKTFNVSGKNFSFSPSEIRVKKGDTVTINFVSESGFHDWVVDEFNAHTGRVNTGGKTSVTFVADKAGTFEYYCSVGSHRQMGMKGNLIVQ